MPFHATKNLGDGIIFIVGIDLVYYKSTFKVSKSCFFNDLITKTNTISKNIKYFCTIWVKEYSWGETNDEQNHNCKT